MASGRSGNDGVAIPRALHPDELLDAALSDLGRVVVHPACRPQVRSYARNVLVGAQGMALHEPHGQIWGLYRELSHQSMHALETMLGTETRQRIVACIEAAVDAGAVLPVD